MSENVPVNPQREPRVIRKLEKNSTKSLNERVLHTNPEVAEQRISLCKKCLSFDDWSCKVTNNFMPKTVRIKSSTCPRGYWSSDYS